MNDENIWTTLNGVAGLGSNINNSTNIRTFYNSSILSFERFNPFSLIQDMKNILKDIENDLSWIDEEIKELSKEGINVLRVHKEGQKLSLIKYRNRLREFISELEDRNTKLNKEYSSLDNNSINQYPPYNPSNIRYSTDIDTRGEI